MKSPRTALITGASRGIGRAIAGRLAEEGWDLLLSARNEQGLNEAVGSLSESGAAVRGVPADMGKPGDVEALATAQYDRGSELDLQFAVNVRAPFHLVSLLLPALRAAARSRPELGARIVAMSSITGQSAEPGLAAYGATKAALTRFCETVTTEEGGNGVLATAFAPGYVDTDMAAWVHESIPPGQMMKTSDVAELTLALTRLSRWAAVPAIVMTRPGPNLHRA
jgi:NAD(P)-dependent dehydrogenase (short-subunit alcohol dehydrogenase family)